MDTVIAQDVPTVVEDRRRPGRVEYQEPGLIALLRQPAEDPPGAAPPVEFVQDPLAPARGLLIGVLAATPLWAIIGLLVWFFLSL